MALNDVEHVEAAAIIRRLTEAPSDPEGLLAARNWLEDHHPSPEAYSAAARSLAGNELDEDEAHAIADELDQEAESDGGMG